MDKSVFSNKPFLFILFTTFLSIMGISIIFPVVPFIVEKYVVSDKQNEIALYVGILTSLYAFCQFIASPVIGAISDKFGRRPVILVCLIGSAVGYILFGIGGSLWILILARMIDGITGGDISTAMAYVADITKPQDRAKYFGIVGATVGFGFMLGPSIGGILSHISLSAPLYFAAIVTLLNVIYGYFVLPESLDKIHRMSDFSIQHLNPFIQIQHVLKNKHLKFLIIIGSFYYFAFAQMVGLLSVFYKDTLLWNPTNIGFFFLILGIGDMFTQGFLTGKLLPKVGVVKLVLAGFLLTAIAFSINALLPIFPFALLAWVYIIIYALGSGLFEPSFSGLISESAGVQEQGRVQGATQSMESITRIIGPIFAAFLYQINHSFSWISCVIFSLAGAYLLMRNRKKNKSTH